MSASTSRYTQQHFRDFAALLAAEREQNGPSPALSRIITAVTALFAENSANFNRELFGHAARGNVPATTRPGSRRRNRTAEQHEHRYDGQALTHAHAGGHLPHGYYKHPEDAPSDQSENPGWTAPVITWKPQS